MILLSRLDGIAARIATAIILAILLGLVMAIGLGLAFNYFGYGQDGVKDAGRAHVILSRSFFGVVNPQRNAMMLSGRIAAIIRQAASAPSSERPRFVAAIAEPGMRVALDASPQPDTASVVDENLERLRRFVEMQLETLTPSLIVSASRPHGNEADDEAVIVATLPDGGRISFAMADYSARVGNGLLLFLLSNVVIGALVSLWTARRLAAPIREFAGAAERLGVDLTAPPLAARGPRELRATIEAVNRMQHRLQRFVEDRTRMLAAISHDLRVPLARLRLRAELLPGGEHRRKMFDDIEAMNTMIESTLAFARDDARQEPRRLVDLGVLVGDVCEDAGDAGGNVSYSGRRGIDVPCRPTLVRRAVANLVDNAVKYGGAARVSIVPEPGRVMIVVDDDGPGIPVEDHEKVFAPFYRHEPARDPAHAGVGLGLSIARTVAREHGGDITLRNRDQGGLSAFIELPA
jgi:signal transduction histidine kinase